MVKDIESIDDIAKVFSLGGISKNTARATLDILNMGDAIDDVLDTMDSFATSQKGINGIGTAFANLGTVFKSFATSIPGAITLITAGVIGAVKLAEKFHENFAEASEKALTSAQVSEEENSKLETVNSQLQETQTQIDTIQSKGTLKQIN